MRGTKAEQAPSNGSSSPAGDEAARGSTLSGPGVDAQAAAERQEHLSAVLRLRRGLVVGLAAWSAFALADLVMVYVIGIGTLSHLFLVRFASLPLLAASVLIAYRKPLIGFAARRALDISIFGLGSFFLSIMSVCLDGFVSLYWGGVALVIICRGVSVSEPWRRALLPNAVIIGAYLAALFGSTLFVERMAAQLDDPLVMGAFLVQVAFLLTTSIITTAGAHIVWSLRRQLFVARSIGRYRLKQCIGKGGMGEVWAAYDLAMKRDVALKLLRPQHDDDSQLVQRFEREVAATAALSHPNTIRVFDFGVTDDGIWYYAMELLDGEDVSTLVRRVGPLPPRRAVRLAHQAACALAEAHEQEIVHRDIKPENLFVTDVGFERDLVKVLDFGIAKILDQDCTLTCSGALVGTPTFISPEAASGKPVDSRSDIYSLGAVLYFMLAAAPPFEADNLPGLIIQVTSEQPPPLGERRGEALSNELQEIVMRCLQKSPEARFPTAEQLARELERCLASEENTAC